MIVPSMNSEELVKEIRIDYPQIIRKANYLVVELRRKAVKSKDKRYQQIFEYKSVRENNWLILVNYINGLPTYTVTVYYLNERGINAISVNGDLLKLYRFSSHFLDRYNERFLKQENVSKLEILKRFLKNNSVGTTEFGKEINDIEQWIFSRFSEGIALGLVERLSSDWRIYHFRTFISNEMVFEDQQKSITKASEFYKTYSHEIHKITGVKSI